jgi:CheY-like chemotaxis protein
VNEPTERIELELLRILEVRPLRLPASKHRGSWPCAACGRGHPIESGWLVLAYGPAGRLDLIVCPACADHAGARVRRPRTVLIAEDNASCRAELREWLERDGVFDVVAETDDGAEVVPAVETHAPDLVLLDLRLPNRDGLEILEALAARTDPPTVAVLTAYPTADAEMLARRLGTQTFLDKRSSRATRLIVELLGV